MSRETLQAWPAVTYALSETEKCLSCGDTQHVGVASWRIRERKYALPLCVMCLGSWVEAITGWKVLNTFAQWQVMSEAGQAARHFKWASRSGRSATSRPSDPGPAPSATATPSERSNTPGSARGTGRTGGSAESSAESATKNSRGRR